MLSENTKLALERGAQTISYSNEAYERFNKQTKEMYNKLVAKPTIRDKRRIARAAKKRK